MPPIKNAQCYTNDAPEYRSTPRISHAEKLELLLAAGHAEDTCAAWMIDRVLEREQVLS